MVSVSVANHLALCSIMVVCVSQLVVPCVSLQHSPVHGTKVSHSAHAVETVTSQELAEWRVAMGQLLQGMDQRLTHIEERVKHLSIAVEKQQAK